MQFLVTSSEMQHYDTHTQDVVGLSAEVLMERAALAVVHQLNTSLFNLQKVVVICGYGNNGGDGVAIARLLTLQKINAFVYLIGDPNKCSPETKKQIKIAKYHNVPILTEIPKSLDKYTSIIDALFGIGLQRPVMGDFKKIIELINQRNADVISVDMPSGISSDTGQVQGVAVKAKQTVTFAYRKLGLTFYPGAEFAGKVTVADIGICADTPASCCTYEPTELSQLLPVRQSYSNKGSFGKVLVIAGSENMSGAAYLSAKAAYRTGAGLVKIYTPLCNREILLSQLPEALMTVYQPNQIDEQQLENAINWASVIIIGPGMGVTNDTQQILAIVLKKAKVPVIIDADALNFLQDRLHLLDCCFADIIVTPHLGEMARLAKRPVADIANHLIGTATHFANQHDVICVLKDARTIVATPNEKTYINQSGNNGMATGGSGDVLTGIIAGLLAQKLPSSQAASVGVFVHGLAGDHAAKLKGKHSLLASDIIHAVSEVLP